MSVQAPLVDAFGQEFYSDMSVEGIGGGGGPNLLSDTDEPAVLSDPDFDSAVGYHVDGFMVHQLPVPRIEVHDQSSPPLEFPSDVGLSPPADCIPSKRVTRSLEREPFDSPADFKSVSGRSMQTCSNCGEGVWLREAAAKCSFTSTSLLCSNCRQELASKKRRNRSTARESSTQAASSAHESSDDTDEPRQICAEDLPDGESASAKSEHSVADPLHASAGQSLDRASPSVHIKCSSKWVPKDNRQGRRLSDDSLSSLDCQRFYFESDNLVLKRNPDYQLLLRTMGVLKAQQQQARKDLNALHQRQAVALADPSTFMDGIRGDNSRREIPSPQCVLDVPCIDWEHYSTHAQAAQTSSSAKAFKPRHSRKSLHHDTSHLYASSGLSTGGASMETFTQGGDQSFASLQDQDSGTGSHARGKSPHASCTADDRPAKRNSWKV